MGLYWNVRKCVLYVKQSKPQVPGAFDGFKDTNIDKEGAREAFDTALEWNLIKIVPSHTGVVTEDYDATINGKEYIKGYALFPWGMFNAWSDNHKILSQVLVPTIITVILFTIKWLVTGAP